MEESENIYLGNRRKCVNSGRSPNFWNPKAIGRIICGIVFGMRFFHARGFLHGDLRKHPGEFGDAGEIPGENRWWRNVAEINGW
jgi:hypothetical protein